MPVNFLSADQAARYGQYSQAPSAAQLARYFYLDAADLHWIRRRSEPYLQLGLAIQLGTVRFLGTFLEEPLAVPETVIAFNAEQLGFTDLTDLPRYAKSEARFDHKKHIREGYGYREFSDAFEQFALVRWLYTRSWCTAESPSVLFDLATARLVERKILLPGATTLERMVAQVRERAEERIWSLLFNRLNKAQQRRLLTLLKKPADSYYSWLELLRHPPTRQSSPSLLEALDRLEVLRELKVGHLDLSNVPPVRIRSLARFAATALTSTIKKLKLKRKFATLLAFAQTYELIAMDEALDVLYALMSDILAKAEGEGQKNRLRTLKDLDAAALTLADLSDIVLDEDQFTDERLRVEAFRHISRESLTEAVQVVRALTRPPDDHHYDEMLERYNQIRRFLPLLLKTIEFEATPAGEHTLKALQFLKRVEIQANPDWTTAPLTGLSKSWRRLVLTKDQVVDKRAFTVSNR